MGSLFLFNLAFSHSSNEELDPLLPVHLRGQKATGNLPLSSEGMLILGDVMPRVLALEFQVEVESAIDLDQDIRPPLSHTCHRNHVRHFRQRLEILNHLLPERTL